MYNIEQRAANDTMQSLSRKKVKINVLYDTVCNYMLEETELQKVAMLSTSLHV